MKITSINYFIKEAFKSLAKNGLMTFASIFTVASCILTLITAYNIAQNINETLTNLENSIGLTVFISDSVNNDDINTLYNKISKMDNVASVTYVSSTDAFDTFKTSLGDNSHILDGLPSDTLLPRSFEIYLKDNKLGQSVINQLTADVGTGKNFSSIRHAQKETDILIKINNVVRIVGLVLILGLSFISIIIIINTIKIAVNNRKHEINIMKYIGATDWFIRWPFIIEGLIIGLVGSIIPIIITYTSYAKVVSSINGNVGFATSWFQTLPAGQLFSFTIPVSIAIGVFIGVLGSVTSIHKHLHV